MNSNQLASRRSSWRWVSWSALLIVLAAALSYGILDANDPPSEAERARALAATIRCPQCQGETVAESNVPIAVDIRADINARIELGETDQQIRQHYASLYGDSVLLTPPGEGLGVALWVVPIAGAALGVVVLTLLYRRRRSPAVGLEAAGEVDADDTASAAGADEITDADEIPATSEGSLLAASHPYRRRWLRNWRVAAVVAVVLLGSLTAGWFLAQAVGFRTTGSEATGDIRQSSRGLLRDALEYYQRGDIPSALAAYDQVLELNPSNEIALAYQGWLIWLTEERDTWQSVLDPNAELPQLQSMQLLSRSVEAAPSYPDARAFRAIIWARTGRWSQAHGEFAVLDTLEVSASLSDLVDTSGIRQEVEHQVGVETAMQAAIDLAASSETSLDPQAVTQALGGFSHEQLNAAGLELSTQGRIQPAILVFTEALRQDPDNFTALTGRGFLFTLPQFLEVPAVFDHGLADLDNAVEQEPQSNSARILRAKALIAASQRFEVAAADLDFIEGNEPSLLIQQEVDAQRELLGELLDEGE